MYNELHLYHVQVLADWLSHADLAASSRSEKSRLRAVQTRTHSSATTVCAGAIKWPSSVLNTATLMTIFHILEEEHFWIVYMDQCFTETDWTFFLRRNEYITLRRKMDPYGRNIFITCPYLSFKIARSMFEVPSVTLSPCIICIVTKWPCHENIIGNFFFKSMI